MQHPASRTLTKIERNMAKVIIEQTPKEVFSTTVISAAELTEIRHNLIKFNREEIKIFKAKYKKIQRQNNKVVQAHTVAGHGTEKRKGK